MFLLGPRCLSSPYQYPLFLTCRATRTQLVCFQSHWCKSSLLSSSATTSSSVTALRQQDPVLRRSDEDQRFGLNFGTIDGSFGAIIPVSEQVYVEKCLNISICPSFFVAFPDYSLVHYFMVQVLETCRC